MDDGVRYGVVRTFKLKSFDGYYDVVKHEPGRADTVLARNVFYPDAVAIAQSMNEYLRARDQADGW